MWLIAAVRGIGQGSRAAGQIVPVSLPLETGNIRRQHCGWRTVGAAALPTQTDTLVRRRSEDTEHDLIADLTPITPLYNCPEQSAVIPRRGRCRRVGIACCAGN